MIYNNADRGVQLYPDAQQTIVDHNVIDRNGEGLIISGDNGEASNNTDVYGNVISNAQVRHDVESNWPRGNPVGVGNVVHDNCVWGGREGTIDLSAGGFTALNNTIADPRYANPAKHNYRMAASSPCLRIVGDVAAHVFTPPHAKHHRRVARCHRHRHHRVCSRKTVRAVT